MSATPDAVAPPPNHRRFPLFDGLRALAVLMVLVVHSISYSPFSSGLIMRVFAHLNLGVTVFFLISGFLLYRPFIAHRSNGPSPPRMGAYGKRRLLRIVPAYWLCLTLLLLVPGAINLDLTDLAGQYGFLQTMPWVGNGGCTNQLAGCQLAHTWSLAVEMTFYALLPLYVIGSEWVARRHRGSGWLRLELSMLAGVSAIAYALSRFLLRGDITSLTGGTAIGFAFWFALGMGIAAVSVATEGQTESPAIRFIRAHPGLLWSAAAALYLAVCAFLPATSLLLDQGQQDVAFIAFGLVSLLLVIPAAFADDGPGVPRRLLANGVVQWLGLVSYGIFLWHIAVLAQLNGRLEGVGPIALILLALSVTAAVAAASYYLLERPLLSFKYTSLVTGLERLRSGSAS